MPVSEAILHPTAAVVILAEITASAWLRAWIMDGTLTNSGKIALAKEPESVTWNGTTALTEQASAALVDTNAGSWHWDGALLWVRPPSGSLYAGTVTAMLRFHVANRQKILDGRFWEPRLLGSPAISQRIEPIFGGVGQIGGGTLELNNADGYFDQWQDLRWDAGSVQLKIGIDLPSRAMAAGEYENLAAWSVTAWSRDLIDGKFLLRLKEPKARIKSRLPGDFFTTDDYPQLEESFVGEPVPIAYGRIYGARPILVDPGTRRFKVAGHAIRSFDGVRILKERAEAVTRTTDGGTLWQQHSGRVWRYYVAGETFKGVTYDGTQLTMKDSVADVIATNGTWTGEENFIYVNPPGGQEFAAGEVVILTTEKTSQDFTTTNFATTDLTNAEFTLGEDWAVGMEVSVDYRGKVDGANAIIQNPVDIIGDLLDLVGETNIDAASFAAARAILEVGIDENGQEVTDRRIAVLLTSPKEIVEVIGEIAAAVGAYVYSDSTGRYYVGIFEPEAGDSLPVVTDDEVLALVEETEAGAAWSRIQAAYAKRDQDDYSQILTRDRDANQYTAGQPGTVTRESETQFTELRDVRDWADRVLCMEGQPLKLYSLVMPWRGFIWKPGQQLWIQYAAKGINAIMECLEVELDLSGKTTRLLLGNLRNITDTAGFWAGELEALPTRFADLAGYGAGSLVWNANWAPEIKNWARKNVGYWTDDNGFADPTDPESFMASTWI